MSFGISQTAFFTLLLVLSFSPLQVRGAMSFPLFFALSIRERFHPTFPGIRSGPSLFLSSISLPDPYDSAEPCFLSIKLFKHWLITLEVTPLIASPSQQRDKYFALSGHQQSPLVLFSGLPPLTPPPTVSFVALPFTVKLRLLRLSSLVNRVCASLPPAFSSDHAPLAFS